MSVIVGIRANAYPDPDDDKRQAARLLVCTNARDADDAALLLDVLGLLPAPDPTNPEVNDERP